MFERHKDLPLHPINVAAFFSQLQRTLKAYRPSNSPNVYPALRPRGRFQSRLNDAQEDQDRDASFRSQGRNTVRPRSAPLLDKLPPYDEQGVKVLCNSLAFSTSQCIDVMGGRELATVAR